MSESPSRKVSREGGPEPPPPPVPLPAIIASELLAEAETPRTPIILPSLGLFLAPLKLMIMNGLMLDINRS